MKFKMIQSGIYFGCGKDGNKFNSRVNGRWGWLTIFHVKVKRSHEYFKFILKNEFHMAKSFGSLPGSIRKTQKQVL